MPAKKTNILDVGLRKVVQDELEKREAMKQLENVAEDEFVADQEDKTAARIFAAFPSSKGYYAKIYRLCEDGKWEIKDYTIDAPETIDDLEIEVKNIVLEKGWGPGTYIVVIKNRDKRGFFQNRRVVVGEPTIVEKIERAKKLSGMTGTGTVIPFPTADPADQSIKLMQAAKSIVTPPPVDIAGLAKVIGDAQKTGAELVAKATPPPTQDSSVNNFTSVLMKMMENQTSILTELIRQSSASKPAVDESAMMERMLKMMKEIGVIGQPQPKEDPLEYLVKLKSAGLIPERKEEDPLSSTEKIMNLINLIRPLVFPESGEKPSALIEALRVIGPQMPKMVENVTGAFRDAADVARLKIATRSGLPPESLIPPRPASQPTANEEPSPPPPQPEGPKEVKSQNPIIQDIIQRIETQDESFFPQLNGIIGLFLGSHVTEGIISGQITIETFAYLAKPYGLGEVLSTPKAKTYLEKFRNWLISQTSQANQAQVSPVPAQETPIPPGVVVGKCEVCGAEFEFATTKDFEANNLCDCGNKLQLVAA